ncbi:hypothetical protein [Flavobacterium panacagri]|uniref:hypothetical protein n=1 Tax=Flavobacterium panacagri TaxID=3034146 RepID=UPI0025A61C03|nr:hypothetical protein [Flavobacterium panacagri]
MKQLFIVVLLFFTNHFFGQSIDSIIKKKSDEFRLKGVKDFFYYESYCVGSIKIVKKDQIDCSLDKSDFYVFWKEKGKSHFEQFTRCENPKVKISNRIMDFFVNNVASMHKEEVERYKRRKDSLVGNKRYSFLRMVSHSCYRKFYFYEGDSLIEKRISQFDLSNEKESPNINFEQNNNLKIVKLSKECDEVIALQKK